MSRTAQYMAFFRALEHARPTASRLFSDPCARHFLDPGLRTLATAARVRPVGAGLARLIDRRWPGSRASGVIRTRLIDDAVLDALREGCGQVAILGAGFDSRAYRLPGIESARVFEIDRAATLEHKRGVLERMLGRLPDHVTYVTLDFERQRVDEALIAAGYRSELPGCVVWEGVTNYLSAAAVDVALRQLARLMLPPGRIVFTYVDREIIEDAGAQPAAPSWIAAVQRVGEPFTFGFDPVTLPAYLAGRGLEISEDVSTAAAGQALLAPLGRREAGAPFYHVATAAPLSGGRVRTSPGAGGRGEPGRAGPEAQARRDQILAAAAVCFARDGVDQTSMQDIVREAEVDPGAILYYFASKDEIVRAIAVQRRAREGAIIATAAGQVQSQQALRILARGFFTSLSDPKERRRRRVTVQLWAQALRQPQILETVRQGVDEPRARLAEILRALQRQGDIPVDLDPDAAARAMISLFLGLVLQQTWDEEVDVHAYLQAVERTIDLLMDNTANRQV